MSLKDLQAAWNRFFFEPASPLPVATFRVAYGLLVLFNLVLVWPDAGVWFTEQGVVPIRVEHKLEPMARLDLMALLPGTEAAARIYLAALAGLAAAVTVGWRTRLMSVLLYLGLTSLHHRNVFILHGGDTLLRVLGFFLIFTEAGALLSVDRWLRLRRGEESLAPPLCEPWAQRLLQLQLATVYVFTFLSKAGGEQWADGTAVYYVLQLEEFKRFPLPLIGDYLPLIKAATWATLAVELSLGTLVWVRELRYPVLLAGVALHLGLEWTMNVPMFQWVAMAAYLNFVAPGDLEACFARLEARVRRWTGDCSWAYGGVARSNVTSDP